MDPSPAHVTSAFGAHTLRLGSTSYVYPASLADNARLLAGQVDDVELVLFETPEGATNLPGDAEIAGLVQIAADAGLTYTVHLPLDLPADREPDPRLWPLTGRVLELTRPLCPVAWIFHIETPTALGPAWELGARRSLERLCALAGDPWRLALENLESYPIELLREPARGLGIRHTVDVGHLWKMGRDPLPVLREWLPDAAVVHLHGCVRDACGVRDHLSLAHTPAAELDAVLRELRAFAGVLTIEVFEDDFFSSRAALAEAWARIHETS